MIISLYLFDKIIEYKLPKEITGSFSFSGDDEDIKLINVEERNGKWVLYQTTDVNIIYENSYVSDIELQPNNYYMLNHENINYLIYVSAVDALRMNWYTFTSNLNIIISNNNSANIRFLCPYLGNEFVRISQTNNQMLLEKTQNIPVYANKKIIGNTKYYIRFGDEIEIYGLKLLFLKSYLFIKNIEGRINVNETIAGIASFLPPAGEEFKELEIKDVDLYQKDDYFSKSPRIRRTIETKELKLSSPPSVEEGEKMPLALVIGPMLTMGIMSSMTIFTTISNSVSNNIPLSNSWPQLMMGGVMLLSTLVWPLVTQAYNKKAGVRARKKAINKYTQYLEEKRQELITSYNTQRSILQENLISVGECVNIINHKGNGFWDKRVDQNDFLVTRIGIGNEKFDCNIQYPEEGFTIEESELRKKADKLVEDFKYIQQVPIGYSFNENITTAIMGHEQDTYYFVDNIILQLVTFYSHEDVKFVMFTNQKNELRWEYLKYLSHSFSNDKSFRFFASNSDAAKNLSDYLSYEWSSRVEQGKDANVNPHYFIIIDGYDNAKNFDIIKNITECDDNFGFSLVIIENRLSKLPSKCANFISIEKGNGTILKNSYEKQERISFKPEIVSNIDMMSLSKVLSNIPIEFQDGMKELPNSLSFLEMEKVGKVEQLNVINRWNTSDSTTSLKAEIGVDSQGNVMYLDLHEKNHGPHGLIAGMTGSGKSEFIITYIASLAINYDPYDVSFILIDYKGGGLAFAFENKETGMSLPHLAGTITNLDTAEMNRTLVSIDSEIKRRQRLFNEARNKLMESTIDIYKYQKFFKEGKLDEPISHLFIICDEFAELKSQQPEFMDNLISVARIGRSLGVHLILATQKPSGVVNDQIWSNTKFRVCLKVQDEQDSKEMLKRPDAAALVQTGRFYLQVGYNEYFALGQSAWCGAKYYPADKIVKQVNKSIDFIDETGGVIKSIQASNNTLNLTEKGEQLGAIVNSIIEASSASGKYARKLWLDNIPNIIAEDRLAQKYGFTQEAFDISAIIGEYDAPENQEQGIILYNLLKDGNTAVYGNDGLEREMFLDVLIHSTTKYHSAKEVNYYIVDYGSEALRKYNNLPQIGGFVFPSEDEKLANLLKQIKEELNMRKKLFVDYGGEYTNYIKNSGKTLPIKVVILNNYDSIYESNPELYDELPDLSRDSERYGFVFILTANAANSIQSKIMQNITNAYAYKLKDVSDYMTVLGAKAKNMPKDIIGRGLLKQNDVTHEFQTAYISSDTENINDIVTNFVKEQQQSNDTVATKIPTLPEFVRFENVSSEEITINNVPVAISKKDLEIVNVDLLSNIGNIVTANKLLSTKVFMSSLIQELGRIDNIGLVVFDPDQYLNLDTERYPDYYTSDFNSIIDKLIETLEQAINNSSDNNSVIIIYGLAKFLTKISDVSKLATLTKLLRDYEKMALIIVDDAAKIKKYTFETWFTTIFSINDGIWIGRGLSDQNLLHLTTITKDMTKDYKNDQGYVITESMAVLSKFIDFITPEEEYLDEE